MSVWQGKIPPEGELPPGLPTMEEVRAFAEKCKQTELPPFTPIRKLTEQQKQEELEKALRIPSIKEDFDRSAAELEKLTAPFRVNETWGQSDSRRREDLLRRTHWAILLYRLDLLEKRAS